MPRRLLVSLSVLLAAFAVAAPAHALTIGIADQKPDMFTDPRFLAAGFQFARRAVPWDALTSPTQTAELDAWMAGAPSPTTTASPRSCTSSPPGAGA